MFPREIIAQFINDSRTLRRFRQTCREYSTMTVPDRWKVTTTTEYDPAHWRGWLVDRRGIVHARVVTLTAPFSFHNYNYDTNSECQLGEETAAKSVTIIAGAPISTWYLVYAGTLAGMYSACLAREHLLVNIDPVMPYRTYIHYFPLEDYYLPVGVEISWETYIRTCALHIDPIDFSHDTVDTYFTYLDVHYDDIPPGAVYACVTVTLLARASTIYAYYGPKHE